MGGSSSKSSSSSNRTTTTTTSNLALEGVDGLTLSNSRDNAVTYSVTDGGAFEVVNQAIQSAENLFSESLNNISSANNKNLEALTKNSIATLEKVNESNQSEQQAMIEKLSTVAIAGVVVYGAVTYWKAKK